VEVAIEERIYRLPSPIRTANGELTERRTLIIRLTDEEGRAGHGEAAPLEPYDGVSLQEAADALERYAGVLTAARGRSGADLVRACRRVADLPQALAAVDVALWDLAGNRSGKPVAALLAAAPADRVPVNATIGAPSPEEAAEEARRAAAGAGFRCVKVKVGVGDDVARVAAVREAVGPEVALRLDANGAWTVEQAVATIRELAEHDLELVEEPVSGAAALRAVREQVAPVRIALDESASDQGALASGCADAVCLKLSRVGGIGELLEQARLARTFGLDVYLASTFEGPIGIAAAVHCAAALGIELPCGLATLPLLGIDNVLQARNGWIAVPDGPGLGIDL